MKKTFILIFIIFLTLCLSGCSKVDYREIYLNEEFVIEEEIKVLFIQKEVKASFEKFYNQNRVRIEIFKGSNNEVLTFIEFDKAKKIYVCEDNEAKFDSTNYRYVTESKTYIEQGYMYKYWYDKSIDVEGQTKVKLDYEEKSFIELIEKDIPKFNYDMMFSDKLFGSGVYSCGKDEYGNIVLLYKNTSYIDESYPRAIVIQDGLPIFVAYKYENKGEYIYQFKYEGFKIKMPNLDSYDKKNE